MDSKNTITVTTEDDQIKLQIAEFESKKELVLESDIPAFFSQDPSIF
jgi:hypothetical protein